MNPLIDKVMEGEEPYKCPRCGTVLKCFFHERDSTSDTMDCPNCHWHAYSGIDAEWHCSDDPSYLFFRAPGVPLKIGIPPHAIMEEMMETWSEKERMDFARALISEIKSEALVMKIFSDRCRHCGKNLLHLAGKDKKCYCQLTRR